uniref:Polypyrimidine tract-binding protein 1 n=1 Tax=Lygus hesperus TaxID=30085 RepID=A0A0A9Z5H4_LYGHE
MGSAKDPNTLAVLFTSGYHHRTKPSALFNPLGRIRPSCNLYISNLIESIKDDDLKKLFCDAGFVFEKYYRKNATTALVSFKVIEVAIDALIAVHAHQMRDRFLRITFSRFAPGPRHDGDDSSKGHDDDEDDDEEGNQAQDVNDEMINAVVNNTDNSKNG